MGLAYLIAVLPLLKAHWQEERKQVVSTYPHDHVVVVHDDLFGRRKTWKHQNSILSAYRKLAGLLNFSISIEEMAKRYCPSHEEIFDAK